MHHPLTPVATVPVDPRRARVHEDGRQSRSPSGARALDTRPHRPTNADRAAVRHRPGGTVPAGAFPGEGPAALDPGDRLPSLDGRGVRTTRRLLSGDR
ncbi:hypothetical protein ABT330_18030 [Streptomyces sp. NPDC000658]|uniref:hypothetical protein n=1 Tax=Streptomyces sp. NPDC000658 TaxID=3154266 RepID=UPI00332E31F5